MEKVTSRAELKIVQLEPARLGLITTTHPPLCWRKTCMVPKHSGPSSNAASCQNKVGGTKIGKRKHTIHRQYLPQCWLLFRRILQTFFPDSVLMHDEAHYDDQWETIRTILFKEIKIKCPGLHYYLTIHYLFYSLYSKLYQSIRRNKS